MNDIQYATDTADFTLFADDSNAFVSDKSISAASELENNCCDQLSVWFRCNLLSINYSKTVYMLFCPSKKDEDLPQNNNNIIIDGNNIDRVYFTKFLGMYIDSRLNFKCHVNYLINKLNSVRGMAYVDGIVYLTHAVEIYFLLLHILMYDIVFTCTSPPERAQ